MHQEIYYHHENYKILYTIIFLKKIIYGEFVYHFSLLTLCNIMQGNNSEISLKTVRSIPYCLLERR